MFNKLVIASCVLPLVAACGGGSTVTSNQEPFVDPTPDVSFGSATDAQFQQPGITNEVVETIRHERPPIAAALLGPSTFQGLVNYATGYDTATNRTIARAEIANAPVGAAIVNGVAIYDTSYNYSSLDLSEATLIGSDGVETRTTVIASGENVFGNNVTLVADFGAKTLTGNDAVFSVNGTIDGAIVGGTVSVNSVQGNIDGRIGADGVVGAFVGNNGSNVLAGGFVGVRQ